VGHSSSLTVTYGIGVILALWGTLSGPFNALGWVAVGLNLLLGSSFAWFELIKPRTSSAGLPDTASRHGSRPEAGSEDRSEEEGCDGQGHLRNLDVA
jgi:hypothetical protein